MSVGLYISHPEVEIDANVPVQNWKLSKLGLKRAKTFATKKLIAENAPIISSTEIKALKLASILAKATNSTITSREAFGENDRSATGYLDQTSFEAHVKNLFAFPDKSVAGWDTAKDAQMRIVGAVHEVLKHHDKSTMIIFTGHGCVGTLLKCHFAKRPIAQSQDQREMAHSGGGNIFAFDLAHKNLLCDWTAMENWTGRF